MTGARTLARYPRGPQRASSRWLINHTANASGRTRPAVAHQGFHRSSSRSMIAGMVFPARTFNVRSIGPFLPSWNPKIVVSKYSRQCGEKCDFEHPKPGGFAKIYIWLQLG